VVAEIRSLGEIVSDESVIEIEHLFGAVPDRFAKIVNTRAT
jgi:hypothetical protein